MPYRSHYRDFDETSKHVASFIATIDPLLQIRYTGFMSVAAACAFEVAIKKSLLAFARKRDPLFSSFLDVVFEKLNAKIKISDLKGEYLKKFGKKYTDCFSDLLDFEDKEIFSKTGKSIKSEYDNLLTWRHSFVHNGNLPAFANFADVHSAFHYGKSVVDCFDITLAEIS